MASISPVPKLQFFYADGSPLVGGLLYSYDAGTTTPLETYADYTGTTLNTNPVVLDSRGEASVWLGANNYKLTLKDSMGVEVWTIDQVGGIATQQDLTAQTDALNAALATLAASGGSATVGFVAAAGTAVPRTVQEKLREWVSVKDFGAIGDGVTDDAVAIGKAITAVNVAGGGTVYFPAGTYVMRSLLTMVSADNIVLLGAGQGASVVKSTIISSTPTAGTAVLFRFDSSTNIAFKSLTLDLNNILTASGNTSAVVMFQCQYVEMTDCAIINAYRVGIWFIGTNDFRVEGCNFIKAGVAEGSYQNEAIACTSVSGAYPVYRGTVINNYLKGWGMQFDGDYMVIEGNTVSAWSYGGGITINPTYSNYPIIVGNNCSDSTGLDVNATYPSGIECWAPYALIQGNVCWNNSAAGIQSQGAWATIVGNNCINNGNTAATGIGIANNYSATYPAAISSYSTVIGNTLGDTGTHQQDYGYWQSDSAGASFVKVVVAENSAHGNVTADYHFGTNTSQNIFRGYSYEGTYTYDLPSIPSLQVFTITSIAVPGAALGDYVTISSSISAGGLMLSGCVDVTNSVKVQIFNPTLAAIDLGSCTFRARVEQRRP